MNPPEDAKPIPTQPRKYSFAEFYLDPDSELLTRNGERVSANRRTLQVLQLLIERRGYIVTKEDFLEHVWENSFVEESNLTVTIATLRKALGDAARDPRFIENVPRRGYRFISEVTCKNDVDPQERQTARPLLKGLAAIIGLAALLAIVSFNRSSTPLSSSTDGFESVAVLPFENSEDDSQYLSDGLTDGLIDRLSASEGLTVVGRNSTFDKKVRLIDPIAAGRMLGAQIVVSGTFVTRTNGISLGVTLTDVQNERRIWSQTYYRAVPDAMALQKELFRDIVDQLHRETSVQNLALRSNLGTDSPEAYQEYLKGLYHWNKRRGESYAKGAEHFTAALDNDPNYALAYVGLANCYLQGTFSFIGTDQERVRIVNASIQKALAIKPELSEAYATRGLLKSYYEWDWAGAENEYKRALKLDPSYASVHHWYAELLAMDARFDESLAEYERAVVLDPLSLAVRTDLGLTYYYAGQHDRAATYLENVKEMDPSYARTYIYLSEVYRNQGYYERAIDEFAQYRRLRDNAGWTDEDTADFKKAVTERGATGFWEKMIESSTNDGRLGTQHAMFLASLGKSDEAFFYLEQAYKRREVSLITLKVRPEFESLRTDPRFADLIQRIGLKP